MESRKSIKICRNCAWSVFRSDKAEDAIIDDQGIAAEFLCRKIHLKVYGTDRACPNFVLADENLIR